MLENKNKNEKKNKKLVTTEVYSQAHTSQWTTTMLSLFQQKKIVSIHAAAE